ncbi:MAG: flagellar basal-body protein FlbY [Hyphomonadaceae bacterium]
MALVADDPADRAEQMLAMTQRLAQLIEEETARIQARAPTAPPQVVEEKARLANAYRLELARIKEDRSLLEGAPAASLDALKRETVRLQASLATHEAELAAVKVIAEGLVQAMAEEAARQHRQAGPYSVHGGHAAPAGPTPVAFNKTA